MTPTVTEKEYWKERISRKVTVAVADSPKQVMQRIQKLSVDHDYIVGDGPAGAGSVSVALLLQADLALLPIMASALDLWSAVAKASKLIEEIQRIRKKKLDVRVVVNGIDNRTTVSADIEDALKQLPIPAATSRIRRLTAFTTVPAKGTTVNRLAWRALSAKSDTEALFRELLGNIKQRRKPAIRRAANE